jgi:hypothetical protein
VTGTPVETPDADRYERSGPYRLEGDRLITPALKEGQAIRVEPRDGGLLLTISDALRFQLRRP